MRSEDDDLETVLTCLEGPGHPSADTHRVERLELDELVVQLHATAARQDDEHLLRLSVAVRERLPPARLDDEVGDAGLLGAEIGTGKPCLLGGGESVPDRKILDFAQVLLRVAHRGDPMSTKEALSETTRALA